MAVRAQRKYAHKAYMPYRQTPCKSDADPPETDSPLSPQPILVKTRKPVADFLNQLAFKKIHREHTEDDKLKDVRVVLKRLSPEPEGVAGLDDDLPSRVINERQRRNVDNQRKSKERNNDSQLNLRGRCITKKIPPKSVSKPRGHIIIQKLPPKNIEKKQNRIGESSRSLSETSNEDNRPLTYYARNKAKEVPATIKTSKIRRSARIVQRKKNKQLKSASFNKILPGKQTYETNLHAQIPSMSKGLKRRQAVAQKVKKVKVTEKKAHKTPAKQTKSKTPKNNKNLIRISEPSKIVPESLPQEILPDSLFQKVLPKSQPQNLSESLPEEVSPESLPQEVLPESLSQEVLPESLSQEVLPESLPEESSINLEDQQYRTEELQSNPFADFIIGVFNNSCDNNEGHEERNERGEGGESESESRVREWLRNLVPQDEAHFKVPATPRWRCATPSTIIISTEPLLSTKEKILRSRCIAWNYKPLSDLSRSKYLIRQFCGECTRCVVMFKSEYLRQPTIQTTVASDIYEFKSERDDEPFNTQTNRNIFIKLSMENEHLSKLKLIMTEKGKIIFKTAAIIKEKIEENKPLLPKEHAILAQVIGILNQCNAARIKESLVAPATRKHIQENYDIISVATSSKRQRLDSVKSSSPPTTIRDSRKFLPTTEEFLENPIKYACKVQQNHPGISLCGIIPPKEFKPICLQDCDTANFKISNQYVHRMLNRWGTATRQLTAIRLIQDPKIQRSPLFEGLEVDLVKLFQTVQSENGIEACQNNKEKWQTIAQTMKLYCRGKVDTKLENIYLKYLLSYNTLTPDEREMADLEVEKCWTQREIDSVVRARQPLWRQDRMRAGTAHTSDNELSTHLEKVCAEAEECVTPGRTINYSNFSKMALQVERTYFTNCTPSPEEVEQEFWNIVLSADRHVCVHAASVDSAAQTGCGFTDDLSDPYGTHQWNLKRLCWNPANLLSYLGPSVGVSSTSIHYGMMFSTSCWHMDPTSVPWIEYLHSGPPKIWYTISANQEQKFRAAAEALCPFAVQNKDIWLPCDIIMIPPKLLQQYGVTVERHVQHVGEYVIVYPRTYCACIDTGLTISEGVYFAPHTWIMDMEKIFLNLRNCCEPSLFSMEKLLIAMARNEETPVVLLQRVHTVLTSLLCAELSYRRALVERNIELVTPQAFMEQNKRSSASAWQIQKSGECAYCRCHLYLSRVVGVTPGQTGVCAMHGVALFDSAMSRRNPPEVVFCVVLITNNGLYNIINKVKQRMVGSVRAAL